MVSLLSLLAASEPASLLLGPVDASLELGEDGGALELDGADEEEDEDGAGEDVDGALGGVVVEDGGADEDGAAEPDPVPAGVGFAHRGAVQVGSCPSPAGGPGFTGGRCEWCGGWVFAGSGLAGSIGTVMPTPFAYTRSSDRTSAM